MIFHSHDGTLIYTKNFPVESPRAAFFIVHGLGEHLGRYEHFIHYLNTLNIAVYAMDLRGHGRSRGLRGHVNHFYDFIGDIECWIHALDGNTAISKDIPKFLLGHSLGGLISLQYILHESKLGKNYFRGLALSAPALGYSSKLAPVQYFFSKKLPSLLKTIHIANGIAPESLCRDPAVVEEYKHDPLVHSWVTPSFFQSFTDASREVPSLLKFLKVPVLFLLPGNDVVVDTKSTVKVIERLEKLVPKLVSAQNYPGFYHEILNEIGKEKAYTDITNWVELCLKQPQKKTIKKGSSRSSKKKATKKVTSR